MSNGYALSDPAASSAIDPAAAVEAPLPTGELFRLALLQFAEARHAEAPAEAARAATPAPMRFIATKPLIVTR